MILLDTFNILHTTGVLPPELAGLDVPALAGLIQRGRYSSEKVIFVCDGLPALDLPAAGPLALDEFPDAAIDVRYSGRAATADDDIRAMIDASSAPRRLIVVSSDHAIIRHARKRRCMALTSEEFLQHLADDADIPRRAETLPRRPSMMSEEQVRTWIDLFAVDETSFLESTLLHVDADESKYALEEADAPITSDMVDPSDRSRPSSAPELPLDLVNEAEAIWKREAGELTKRIGVPDPRPTLPGPALPSTQDETPVDPLDMNAFLPNDGRTSKLRHRDNRHRPS